MAPVWLERAIKILPLTLDCIFSSVVCPSSSLITPVNVALKFSTILSISIVLNSILRFSANDLASRRDSFELYLDGIATPITFLEPRASTATVAVNAESIPPDSPISTFSKLFFFT